MFCLLPMTGLGMGVASLLGVPTDTMLNILILTHPRKLLSLTLKPGRSPFKLLQTVSERRK